MTNDERKAILFEAAAKGRALYDDERDELATLLRSGTVDANEGARLRAAFPIEYAYITAPQNRFGMSRVGKPPIPGPNRGPMYTVIAVIAIVVFASVYGVQTAKSLNSGPSQSQAADSTANPATAEPAATDAPPPDMNLKTIGVSPTSTGENKNWACPATKEQFNAMTDALTKSDNEGYQESVADGVALEPGTKVRILDHTGMLGTVVKLRILSGPDEGRACYASADADGFFKEGYP